MNAPSEHLRVGVVGASLSWGWGASAHLPALAALPRLDVVAVATTRRESAEETAAKFGVPLAFADATQLIEHPDVDLVTVAVKVPGHGALVRAALDAGKHVYCEWPLGVDATEAASLAGLAAPTGVTHLVGLQAWHAPGVRYVAELVSSGTIGAVTSASVVAAAGLGGVRLPRAVAYTADRANGANLLTITAGHALAAIARTVGSLEEVSSVVATGVPEAMIAETGEMIRATSPGQIAVAGVLEGGAVLSLTVQGGAPPSAGGFRYQIVGTDGALVIGPARPGGSIHIDDWTIRLCRGDAVEALPVPAPPELPATVAPGPPKNVALLYQELARAITEGRPADPGFDAALRHHRLLASIEAASRSGTRQVVAAG